jgi:hypothetical protein
MNARRFFLLFVPASAALSAAPDDSFPDDTALVGHRVGNHGPWDSDTFIKPGDSRGAVRQAIGVPPARFSPDVWVYWNYRTNHPRVNQRGFDTLLVIFKGDRVLRLDVVAGEPIRQRLAQTAPASVAGRKSRP